jgi:hypothetical protein
MTTQRCNRIELAHEQLELAVTLFLDAKSYASVITLASAAERVMGQALRHRSVSMSLRHLGVYIQ